MAMRGTETEMGEREENDDARNSRIDKELRRTEKEVGREENDDARNSRSDIEKVQE